MTVQPGDRLRCPVLANEIATVIEVTGDDSAVVRFDADVAFAKKYGRPESNADIAFTGVNAWERVEDE